MRLFAGGKLSHMTHISLIACFIGTWSLTQSGMFQVEAIAPTPLPGVIEVEHRLHPPLAHLAEQIVETCQERVVINSRSFLQRRFHFGGNALLTITSHKDTQVIEAKGMQIIQLTL